MKLTIQEVSRLEEMDAETAYPDMDGIVYTTEEIEAAMDAAFKGFDGDYKDAAVLREEVLYGLGIDLGTDALSCPRSAMETIAAFMRNSPANA